MPVGSLRRSRRGKLQYVTVDAVLSRSAAADNASRVFAWVLGLGTLMRSMTQSWHMTRGWVLPLTSPTRLIVDNVSCRGTEKYLHCLSQSS